MAPEGQLLVMKSPAVPSRVNSSAMRGMVFVVMPGGWMVCMWLPFVYDARVGTDLVRPLAT